MSLLINSCSLMTLAGAAFRRSGSERGRFRYVSRRLGRFHGKISNRAAGPLPRSVSSTAPSGPGGPHAAAEVAFALLGLQRAFFIEVDQAALALGVLREQHLADDVGQGRGARLERARQRVAA